MTMVFQNCIHNKMDYHFQVFKLRTMNHFDIIDKIFIKYNLNCHKTHRPFSKYKLQKHTTQLFSFNQILHRNTKPTHPWVNPAMRTPKKRQSGSHQNSQHNAIHVIQPQLFRPRNRPPEITITEPKVNRLYNSPLRRI